MSDLSKKFSLSARSEIPTVEVKENKSDLATKFEVGTLPSKTSDKVLGLETSIASNLITNNDDFYTTSSFSKHNEDKRMSAAGKVALATAVTLLTLIIIGLLTGVIQDSPIAKIFPWLGNIPSLGRNGRKAIQIPCFNDDGDFVGNKSGYELNNIFKVSSGKVSMAGSEVELKRWGGVKSFYVIPKSDINSHIRLYVESVIISSSGNISLNCISEKTGPVSLTIGDATSII